MAALPVIAPEESCRACGEGAWRERATELRFLLAGVAVHTFRLRALVLAAPWSDRGTDDGRLPPPPREFPPGIDATRIFACPMRKTRRSIALVPGAIRYVSSQSRHFYIEMAGSFPEYLSKFRAHTRGKLQRTLRKYREEAGHDQPLREFSRPAEMEEFHGLALAVAVKTYQHRLLDAALPASGAFRRELKEMAERGQVRGYILMHRKQPSAYCLCDLRGDVFTLGKTGFAPEFAALRPGIVLFLLLIERAFAEGRFRLFDFGCGDFRYKESLATGYTWCGDLLFLRRTPLHLAVVAAHRALNLASDGMKKILELAGLKARVKKLIHHGI